MSKTRVDGQPSIAAPHGRSWAIVLDNCPVSPRRALGYTGFGRTVSPQSHKQAGARDHCRG
jgi:hypothetical protein